MDPALLCRARLLKHTIFYRNLLEFVVNVTLCTRHADCNVKDSGYAKEDTPEPFAGPTENNVFVIWATVYDIMDITEWMSSTDGFL